MTIRNVPNDCRMQRRRYAPIALGAQFGLQRAFDSVLVMLLLRSVVDVADAKQTGDGRRLFEPADEGALPEAESDVYCDPGTPHSAGLSSFQPWP